jgi:hypothetical protein
LFSVELDFLFLGIAVALDRFAEFLRLRHGSFTSLLETVLVPPDCDHTVNHWRVISAHTAKQKSEGKL